MYFVIGQLCGKTLEGQLVQSSFSMVINKGETIKDLFLSNVDEGFDKVKWNFEGVFIDYEVDLVNEPIQTEFHLYLGAGVYKHKFSEFVVLAKNQDECLDLLTSYGFYKPSKTCIDTILPVQNWTYNFTRDVSTNTEKKVKVKKNLKSRVLEVIYKHNQSTMIIESTYKLSKDDLYSLTKQNTHISYKLILTNKE